MARRFDLDAFLPFRLNRLAAEVSERLSRIYAETFAIDIPQWRVIATLAGKERATAQAIVQSTRTHKSTISRAVQELADKGLIARVISGDDKRAYLLKLTPEGRKLFRQLEPLVLDYQDQMLGMVSGRDADALLRGVGALEAALNLDGDAER